jgi:hypothetical protein
MRPPSGVRGVTLHNILRDARPFYLVEQQHNKRSAALICPVFSGKQGNIVSARRYVGKFPDMAKLRPVRRGGLHRSLHRITKNYPFPLR